MYYLLFDVIKLKIINKFVKLIKAYFSFSLDAGSSRNKEYSIDSSFLIKQQAVPSFSHQSHPINHLDDLTDDLFGHMDVDKLPSANKRRKTLRRMERKFAKTIPIPEPVKEIKVSNLSQASHSFNEFIKSDSKTDSLTEVSHRNPGSKWDIKDMSTYKTVSQSVTRKKHDEKRKNLVGCKPETLYTVKDNRIVRLEKKSNVFEVKGDSRKLGDCYDTVEIKLPINKAEEKLLEGSRLSLEDIKKIPKFENYDPGECSKVSFVV